MAKRLGKKKEGQKADELEGLPPLNRNAAGIDVGSAAHYVAVPAGRDAEPVQEFGSFTADLHRMAQWLKACRVDTVVMQATGVYWTALYDVLESYGFEVNVVNARHTKTLPGRKTDVLACQWLQKLHTFGLLNNSFRPAEEIRVLRSYMRQRENLVTAAGTAIQHMLTEMNIRRSWPCISTVGFRPAGRRWHAVWRARGGRSCCSCWSRAWSCTTRIWKRSRSATAGSTSISSRSRPRRPQHNRHPHRAGCVGSGSTSPASICVDNCIALAGVDVTQIDGVDVQTAQTAISEVGVDMSRWKTEKQFASWLGIVVPKFQTRQ